MTSLPRFSVENPILANLLMVGLIVGGVYSGLTLVRELFPESRPNRILITTLYPGATPAEVEKGITLKLEERIKDVEGVEKIVSKITEGRSQILVELQSGIDDITKAVNDTQAAIDAIPTEDFPEEALETSVMAFEPRWPVISISLYGDLSDRELKDRGEELRSDLLLLPDVTNVSLTGSRKDEISIYIRPEKLAQYGLSFMEVSAAIAASNLDLPGGSVKTGNANVSIRTLGEEDRGADLYDIIVRSDPSGRVVFLRDVAVIEDGFEDVDIVGRFNAAPAVRATVFKTPKQDAIKIAGLVRAYVAGKMGRPLERSWTDRFVAFLAGKDVVREAYERARAEPFPPGVRAGLHTDLSRFIEGRLELLERNGFWGLLLVMASLLFFLNWRVAFWVIMGLALAVAGSLICMRLLGQSLNLMTMLGLIVVLGLLVDDAIIVSEHVFTKVEQGIEPRLAAIQGAEEVTWPVVCAIITTIVAFIPLMFVEGQIGDWMGVLPVIVCVALAVSLFESLSILPSHLAHGLRPLTGKVVDESRIARSRLLGLAARLRRFQDERVQQPLRTHYERFLRFATRYRYVTMAALTACLIITVGMVAGGFVPWVLIQKMDSETLVADIRMGVGAPIEETARAALIIERTAMALPERKTLYTLLGLQLSDDGLPSAPQSHLGQIFLELTPAEARDRSSEDIIRILRAETADIPGIEKLRFYGLQGGPGGAPIHIDISGKDPDELLAVARELEDNLRSFDGVFDIIDNFDAGRREVQIELFESARALGLTTESLAVQVRSAFYGYEARKIQRGREDVKIMVRYPPEARRRIYDIESMRIATPAGKLVPFTEVARLTEQTGYASINRINQRRCITITADVDNEVTKSSDVIASLSAGFPELQQRYPGVRLEFGGQKLETTKSFGSLKKDFVAALLMIYVILAALFGSYIQPMIVMSVIPFGLIGAVLGHFVMGYPLTILSMIGLVALTGILVNDSMILVAFINRSVAKGVPLTEAVIQGGLSRLRAILLTSATTVLGIAPLLSETSFQAKFLIPMGLSIAAGLMFATVLTLVAVPSLYLIIADIAKLFTGREYRPTTAGAMSGASV